MEIVVNGKKVVLRESYPTREYDKLRKQFAELDNDTPWRKRAAFLRNFIDSWEMESDPKDIEAWGDLDFFSETLAIEKAIGDLITEKAVWAKNSESESTTP